MVTSYWIGKHSNDYYDPDNWSYGNLPQSLPTQAADITGTANHQVLAIANAASANQIQGVSIGENGTLKITAQGGAGFAGNVFAMRGFEIFAGGQMIIDTPSPVELGTVNEIGGTLTILNNPGRVTIDGTRLSGNGTLNLINSRLGSAEAPIDIDSAMTVTLQTNSIVFSGFYADGGTVLFDPASTNTFVLNGQESTITTHFSGVSENTIFAINATSGVTPIGAYFQPNDHGNYSLLIEEEGGKTLTLNTVTLAEGFSPSAITIIKTSDGLYTFHDSNTATTPANYNTTALHQHLASTAASAQQTGSQDQSSTTPYTQHNPQQTNTFIGGGTAEQPGDWSNAKNWSLGTTPQQNGAAQASIAGAQGQPLHVRMDAADIAQFAFLTIANAATLTIVAEQSVNPESYVFTTQGFQIWTEGSLIIDTPAKVDLGSSNTIGGTLTIQNNPGNVVFDTTCLNGAGTLILANTTLGSAATPLRMNIDHIVLNENSTAYAAPFSTGTGSVTFDNSANTYVISGEESTIDTVFNNVSDNTCFAINGRSGLNPVSSVWTQNKDGSYALTILLSDGHSLVLRDIHTDPSFNPGENSWNRDPAEDWVMHTQSRHACYLTGTQVLTDCGSVAVEKLKIGDKLAVLDDVTRFRPIIWVGARDVRIRPGNAATEYPVRIKAHALGQNLPQRDLLVTPEHCLYLDGAFIPARMLVNTTTILHDLTISAYRYVHVETDQHSIMFAENVAAETYLDTGNRSSFTAGPIVSLPDRQSRTRATSAAPLQTSRMFVEPIVRRIEARAITLGYTPFATPALTHDPALQVTDQNGQPLRLLRKSGSILIVMLTFDTTTIQILSRVGRPDQTIGPFMDDRRSLGVLIGQVTLWEAQTTRTLTTHLTQETLCGWHPIDHPALRWTRGRAHLDLGPRPCGTPGILSLQIVAAGPYHYDNTEPMVAASA